MVGLQLDRASRYERWDSCHVGIGIKDGPGF